MELFGRQLSRRDLCRYTGRLEQVAGVTQCELADGRERGVRMATVRNGGGLSFGVLLDRGLDIGPAEYKGIPFAFYAPGDFASPAFFDPSGINWLRTWGAGLLTGCGLRNVGGPGEVDGESFSLHGRLSNLPARNVRTGEEWDGDECTLVVEGQVSESRLFGENLRMVRRISSGMGTAEIVVESTVENLGFEPEPVFALFHTNLGFPLVDAGSRLEAAEHAVTPRDEGSAAGVTDWHLMQPPTPGYAEQVFYHDIPADACGYSTLSLCSPGTGLAVDVSCRKEELPTIVQWKMMGQGAYVTGIEPSNCRVGGREEELARGPHCVLAPGETRTFDVRIRVREEG